ncbi:hypothetical protein QAD02_006687 [Eretmocerus hayati]|uniref:Uncharacterized protein n=1 Tax=Eretmocerus hayati TaxID=131215 RepID=A0ACC2N5V2_9HYME|nr:hypothetical protein QAD02_006687 [Eretmocerus hayati]
MLKARLKSKREIDEHCRFLTKSPVIVSDAQRCADLCTSCNGVVSFIDNRCECKIEPDDDEGTECLVRMRRQAAELGINLVSCGDQRSTRCTVGSKHHAYNSNQIEHVAKYFENKGPMTGSVFIAPPFNKKSGDCVGSSPVSTPVEDNVANQQPETLSLPYQQMVSLQQFPQQFIITAVPPQQLLAKTVSSPNSRSSCSGTVGSPGPQQSPSHIITQPPETLSNPGPSDKVSSPLSSPRVGTAQAPPTPARQMVATAQAPPTPARQMVGAAPQPAQAVMAPVQQVPIGTSMQPYLMKALSAQLSQPMLGIPQAIHTIGSTPGISELVGAPAHLLNVFMRRMGFEPMQMASNPGQRDITENVGTTLENDDESVVDNSCVGSENPTTGNQQTNPSSEPQLVPLPNPTVGNANPQNQISFLSQANTNSASGQVSYVPSMAMISSPMVGSTGPYNYMQQMPTYIVGSPFGFPYLPNNNMGSQNVGAINPSIMAAKSTPDEPSEPNTAQSNPIEPEITPQKAKKLCKKSYGQLSRKSTRGIRAASASNYDDKMDAEIERERKLQLDAESNSASV